MKLSTRFVEKPWGRTRLPPMFERVPEGKIGEVWFLADPSSPLLAKYLFTSERVSVQVHPDDDAARARGLDSGKSECWFILEADADAKIGLGFRSDVTRDQLRSSALDGSIVDLVDWRTVTPGDFFYVPAGTVHGIGGGISLLEFEQNSDVTFRLYDYERARGLQVDDAIAVADLTRYPEQLFKHVSGQDECTLVDGPRFTVIHTCGDTLPDRRRWILPLEGNVRVGSDVGGPGECLLAEPGQQAISDGARMLIGAES